MHNIKVTKAAHTPTAILITKLFIAAIRFCKKKIYNNKHAAVPPIISIRFDQVAKVIMLRKPG